MPTVYVTAPRSDAEELAETLIEERLAACVNMLDCHSVYRWEGGIVSEEEAVLLVKTTDERYPELKERIEELHPYDVPCIKRFEETDVLAAFDEWIESSVA